MEKKSFKSVSSMINNLSNDEDFKRSAKQNLFDRRISKILFLLRCKNGLSQKDLAEKIGCTQGKISKLESSNDKDISIKDLIAYANILNLQLEIGFCPKNAKLVDQIKYHALAMFALLEQLAILAKDDPSIEEGVRKFHYEAFVNMMNLISTSYSNLPAQSTKEKQTQVEVFAHGLPIEKDCGFQTHLSNT